MTAAILFNMDSSPDDPKMRKIGAGLESFLRGHRVVSHRRCGAALLPFADKAIPGGSESPGADHKASLRSAVRDVLSEDPGLIVTVGGDGLASYVADAVICLRETDRRPTLMGVAAGTANVGPIVSFSGSRLASLSPEELSAVPVDAVEVLDGVDHVGYAFNDVILGNSLLATVDGRVCNVSVEQLAGFGRKVRIKPGDRIAAKDFRVTLGGDPVRPALRGDPGDIRQIIASPLQFDRLYGRAILGGLCNGAEHGPLAALGLCDRVVVDSDPETWRWKGFTGIRHLVFSPETPVSVSGLGKDAHIVVDGNPFVRRSDSVAFRCAPGQVRVYRDAAEGRGNP